MLEKGRRGTPTRRTLGNARRKASGFEEGEFFVDKVSWMYLQDNRVAAMVII